MRPIRLAACALLIALTAPLFLTAPGTAAPSARQTAPFRSVELRNGGEVLIRHAPEQRIIFASEGSRARVVDGRLIVEVCPKRCAHGDRTPVTVLTPSLDGVAVSNGGMIRVEGSFPRQTALSAAVEQGGTIDIRGMKAASVAATISQGGRMFTRPLDSLIASVRSGGRVAYWGDPSVQRAIAGGGVIEQGRPEDEGRPLAEFDPPPIPPLPQLPPIPHHRRSR
jgi:Putative auto-transporter adhesin, head GIN domain